MSSTNSVTDRPTVIGFQHITTGEAVCADCRDHRSESSGWLAICEGDTHSGQFENDPCPVSIPVDFRCKRCGEHFEA